MQTRARQLRARGALCALIACSVVAAAASGCLNRPIDRLEPRTTSTIVEPLAQSRVQRIDILLAIDNSISMGDKQQILATAVPDLVDRLITPDCLDIESGARTGQKADPKGNCPAGSEPEFKPVTDVNIGIISSSLGDLATGSCSAGGEIIHPDDKGHLLTRKKGSPSEVIPTYEGKGFLAWDPNDERAGEDDPAEIRKNVADLLLGVDQLGCGFEMQLEAVYRFLADPDPYLSLTVDANGQLVEVDTDDALLAQRADFLRPDSLVAVVMLSDENDCSINIQGRGFQAPLGGPFYRATDECAVDPNDPCCTSCALPNPEGCAPDPATCGPDQGTNKANKYTPAEDQQGWRCADQKRHYGVNLLYPTARYVNALTKARIDPTRADLAVSDSKGGVENPLWFGKKDGVAFPRPPGFVYLAGIVGVPWQAIAKRNDAMQPDLSLGFQTVEELEKSGVFEKIAGRPDENIAPTDPFMAETPDVRAGTSDVVGASPAAANDINGGDRSFSVNDLQYACIFPLLDPQPDTRDCSACADPACDNPLCNGTTQIAAKAYPGTRELAVIRGLGEQGIPASICPEQLADPTALNYGYAPAVRSIIDKLKTNFLGKCLPRELKPDEDDGRVQCLIVEARTTAEGACTCDAATGRVEVPATLPDGEANPSFNAVELAEENEFNPGWNCFCEIQQLLGAQGSSCQRDVQTDGINGWCYVDPITVQGSNPELVEDCEPTERRKIRFVGDAEPLSGATAFITCTGE